MTNKILKSIISILVLGSTISCTNITSASKDGKGNGTNQEIIPTCSISTSSILEGTLYETPVYTFSSNVEGPKVAIIGGIHGDEVAGWMAAERLIERTDYKGTVMIIPYANILADIVKQRYLGIGNSGYITNQRLSLISDDERYENKDVSGLSSIKFTDLNRSFPGDSNGTDTQKIAKALYDVIMDFSPNFLVDLHESRHNYSVTKGSGDTNYLGTSLITGNSKSSLAALSIVSTYNDKYKPDGETYTEFCKIDGYNNFNTSYDYRFARILGDALSSKKSRVLTIETNREAANNNYNTTDLRNSEYRITEQLRMVDLILEEAYQEYLDGKFK